MTVSKISTIQLPFPDILIDKKQTPWRSVIVCGIISTCQAMQFSLYLASLWPYLQLLDASITENFYGYVMAAYSLGQITSAPLMGLWSTRIKSIVKPSQCSLSFVFLGNAVYFLTPLLPTGRKWAVLIARFMVGLGAGNMSMMQTYAATASLPNDRSRTIAIVTGGVSLGMCLGPGLQLFFTPLDYPGIHLWSTIKLNMYTAPAITCCFINMIAVLILQFVFEEKYAGLANDRKTSKADKVYVPPYDKVAISLCHFTRFTQWFTWSNMEILGAPLAMSMFALSREQAVKYFASSHLALGLLSLSIYIVFIVFKMEKFCDFRKICISGLMGFVLFHVVTFSWPFLPGKVQTYSNAEYDNYLSGNVTIEPVGCPIDRFSWCENLAPVNIWVFFVMFVITVGGFWSEINISLGTILSNVIGPRQQANQQSIFYTSGAVARLTGPIIISNLYTNFGPRVAWIIEVVILSITISMWFLFYNRMIPLILHVDEKSSKTDTTDENEN